jgi:hypothetical protein
LLLAFSVAAALSSPCDFIREKKSGSEICRLSRLEGLCAWCELGSRSASANKILRTKAMLLMFIVSVVEIGRNGMLWSEQQHV